MFPQQQPQPRNEMYEYPTTEVTTKELLQRRLNHWNDIFTFRILTLETLNHERAKNPQAVKQMQNNETKAMENVSITAQVIDQQEVVCAARNQVVILERMISAIDAGTFGKMYDDEALTAPEIGIPSNVMDEPKDDKGDTPETTKA